MRYQSVTEGHSLLSSKLLEITHARHAAIRGEIRPHSYFPASFKEFAMSDSEREAELQEKFEEAEKKAFAILKKRQMFTKSRWQKLADYIFTRWRAKNDLFWLANQLGYKDLGKLHRYLCDWLRATDGEKKRVIFIARGHFKTTIDEVRIIQNFMRNRNRRVLIYVGDKDTAQKHMPDQLKTMALSQFCQKYFKDVFPPVITGRAASKILRDKDAPSGVSWNIVSVESGSTGMHYDELCCDDVVCENNYDSPTKRAKVKERANLILGTLDPGWQEIIIGTPYHEDDWYWTEVIPSVTGEDEWLVKYSLLPYCSKNVFWVPAEWMDQYGNYNIAFPERFTPADLDERARRESMYMSQYELVPATTISNRPIFWGDYTQCFWNILPARLFIVTGVDPATRGFQTRHKDYAAVVTVARDSEDNIYYLSMWRHHSPSLEELAIATLRQAKENNANVLAIQVFPGEFYFYETVIKILHENPEFESIRNIKIETFRDRRHSKEYRIEHTLRPFWSADPELNRTYFATLGMDRLIQEYRTFGTSQCDHDDVIDAAATAVMYTQTPEDIRTLMHKPKQDEDPFFNLEKFADSVKMDPLPRF